jgi:hypothetical protein
MSERRFSLVAYHNGSLRKIPGKLFRLAVALEYFLETLDIQAKGQS